ncbi:MAG: choice-of-anchor L domain-containing protein [Bacteroidales bacterium]|nr:choice-of-anchor L domain-containing protein [Bacteroidales bacterium]
MMGKNFKHNAFTIVLMFFALLMPCVANAQLQITPGSSLTGWTPDSLVRNVMLGQGVDISNVRFNGSSTSINCNGVGKFTTGNTPTTLGMSEGIILSASAMSYIVPNGSGTTHNCPIYSDADLINTVHSWGNSYSVNNQSVLEFDFIPKSDTIKFRFVFASEEYYGFECSEFNDIFAFFLQGPNPNGGTYNQKNIALVPGTDTAITISTINGGQSYGSESPCCLNFAQYFVAHPTFLNSSLDGMTVVLTAQAAVIPCQNYHLKMCVANVSDQSLPSCVFLEANSLSSNGISFTFDNPSNPQNPSDLYEGCMAIINLERPQAMPVPTPIDVFYDATSTALNGTDFEMKNSVYYFPADTTRATYTILPYKDGEIEGTESVMFRFRTYETCPADTVQFNILDVLPMTCTITRDTLTSETFSTILTADIQGGMPNCAIEWKNLENGQMRYGQSINIPTSPDSRWALYVHDSCYNYGFDTMLVGIRRQFAYPYKDTIICANEPLDLYMRFLYTDMNDSCVWYRGTETTPFELKNDTVHLTPSESAMYYIHSYITWNGQIWEDVDSIRVIVVPLPETHVSASSDRICEGSSTTLSGNGSYKYSWDGGETFATTSTFTYMPDTTTMFVLYGLTAGAECYGKDSILITVDTIPDIILGDGGGVCGGEEAELTVTTTAESFTWTANPADPTLGGQEHRALIIVNPASTTVYTVNAVNGVCTNSESVTVAVEPMPVAVGEVTPRTVSLGQMEAVFSDHSLHSTTRRWEFPDGATSELPEVSYIVPDDVDSINVRLWAYNPYACFDTTTVTVYVDHTTIWVPNAFTPEESTNNTFLVKMNDVQRYHLFIYDRHGALVFESYNPEEPWNGTGKNGQKCPQGVYTYLISCHKITYPFDQIIRKGTVVLIR